MKNLINELSDLRGVSGFEYRICDEIKKKFEPFADDVQIDTLGNIIAHKKAKNQKAIKLLIEAHYDEIGLIVTSISDKGMISFANVGGVDNRILPSLEVVIHGKEDVYGVIGIKPGYMLKDGKNEKTEDLRIDTGLCPKKIKELIKIGDSITIAQSVGQLGDSQWSGKSLDDRASVAILISFMEKISKLELPIDVYAVATVQEEVGCRGAKTCAYSLNPDMAIAIDVTHGITPDNNKNAFKTGDGIVISVGPNLHSKLTNKLIDTCKKNSIAYNIEAVGGDTGTDAWEIQISRAGIPTSLLSIPLKYMHTSVETLDFSDVDCAINLICKFIKELEGDLEWLKF